MPMLTTTQVRAIMRENGGFPAYTNKSAGHTGNIRRVKAYYNGNAKMLAALREKCGISNVNLTDGASYVRGPSLRAVTVRCTLA
jgi:hypothetical protein